MRYLTQIDSFRFFAAFAVLTSHWLHNLEWVQKLKLGFIGVDFFFVISGFLISYQLFNLKDRICNKEISKFNGYLNFVIRRAFRIFPLYYVVLIAATLFNTGEIRDAFVYNLTYTSNFYFIKTQEWNSIFSHFWSLAVEEHFYLIWPFLLVILRKKSLPFLLLALAVSSLLFRLIVFSQKPDYFTVHIHTLSCIDVFMFGAALAYFYKNRSKGFEQFFMQKSVRFIIFFGIGIVYTVYVFGDDLVYYSTVYFRTLFGIFSAGILGLIVVGFKGVTGKIFENRWLVKGGKLSYAIYLIHNFIPGLLLEIEKLELPLLVRFVIYFVATILISTILHKFIENPMRKLGKKYS